jgi:hypothetical protein
MRFCSSFLHSRKELEYDTILDVERDGVRTALHLATAGLVMTSSLPVPRRGKCIVERVGITDGIPEVIIRRAADASLFTPEEDAEDSSGRMTGVVEDVGLGRVSIGGAQYHTEDDGILHPGQRISYVLGPDNFLEVVDVLESGVRISTVDYCKLSVYSKRAEAGDNHLSIDPDPRSKYGVTVGKDGDIMVIRMVARNGADPAFVGKNLEGHRFGRRMNDLGAVGEKTPEGMMWRLDMSKPFAADKKESGYLGLVHLVSWLRDKSGGIPAEVRPIFDELRDWVAGRRSPVAQ